jgi:formamidopyrimidine-DNA glycosylase
MPELPEVETMRRGIAAIVGRRIVVAEAVKCASKPILISPRGKAFQMRAVGQKVTAVDRVGKRVVVRLENEHSLILEPRMTGLVLIGEPPSAEHLRFRVDLNGGPIRSFWYWDRRGLGSVRLLSPAEFQLALGPEKLGPDALLATPELLQAQLGGSRREIKVALLDQKVIAGIGNLYASEILHLAKIHPAKRCDTLRRPHWQALNVATLEILQTAIRYEGSTLGDGTYRNALNQAGGYQNEHRVYDRAGEVCRSCGKSKIVRTVQAQRSTFHCGRCQRQGKSNS